MSDLTLIMLCLALVGAALLLVSFINSQQTRKRLIHQKLVQLKRKVTEMDELSAAVETLSGHVALTKAMLDETLDLLMGMRQLSPGTPFIEVQIEAIVRRVDTLSSPGYSCPMNRLMASDAAIARAQYLLEEAGQIVRKRQNLGKLEHAQMKSFIVELAWAHLMVVVVTLVGQGHKAREKNDLLRARAFYKKAHKTAMESKTSDDRFQTLIKQLVEIQDSQREQISAELMPEIHDLNGRETN